MVTSLKILHLGPQRGTCLDRANAFRRLGHQVEHLDPRQFLPRTQWIDRITWHLGGHWFGSQLADALSRNLSAARFDLCQVESSEWMTPEVIAVLRRHCDRIVSYSIDDPLGRRDGARFSVYRRHLSHFDLCVVVRQQNITEAYERGARAVMRVFMSADEVTHAPRRLTAEDRQHWAAEVQFLGTWFPERGQFLLKLLRLGVPLQIRGSNWDRAPEWPELRAHCRLGELTGDAYAKAIQCARVNIGLVSKGNRDQHTTRTMEVPALGALLCAERTIEHRSLYAERQEALFWSDSEECAAMCRYALEDEERRLAIAAAGRERLRKNGHYNQQVLAQILERALQIPIERCVPDKRRRA